MNLYSWIKISTKCRREWHTVEVICFLYVYIIVFALRDMWLLFS